MICVLAGAGGGLATGSGEHTAGRTHLFSGRTGPIGQIEWSGGSGATLFSRPGPQAIVPMRCPAGPNGAAPFTWRRDCRCCGASRSPVAGRPEPRERQATKASALADPSSTSWNCRLSGRRNDSASLFYPRRPELARTMRRSITWVLVIEFWRSSLCPDFLLLGSVHLSRPAGGLIAKLIIIMSGGAPATSD